MFVPRESDGDGIGVPNRMALKEAADRWKRLFLLSERKGVPKMGTPFASLQFYGGACGLLQEAGTIRPVRQPASPAATIGVVAQVQNLSNGGFHASHYFLI